jgi:hypothetical protein
MTYKRIRGREGRLPRPDKSGLSMTDKDGFPLPKTVAFKEKISFLPDL